jgi:hypothetical protein
MNAEMLNTLFIESLENPQELTKLADETSSYVRTRMREVSFARKIMMPEPVTKADCQRSVNHDQLVKIVDIEPNSYASAVNFRGRPENEYIVGERYEIPFYGISSREYQKTEEELLAYEMPITEIIENNSLKDLHAIEDEGFIGKVETNITSSGKSEDATAFNTVSGELDPSVFVRLFNLLENSGNTGNQGAHNFDAKRYDTDSVLMNRSDYNKLLLWRADDRGNNYADSVTINGFTYSTVFGKKIIVTQKGELVPPGTIYAFAAKPYIGHAYILGDVKFWIEKKRNVITWSLYEIIAYGIGNAFAMAKVTFTN